MPTVKVIKPGLLTTVQDTGRFGHRHEGIPVSGAVDRWAFMAANRLAGNEPEAACLEMTIKGPVLRFLRGAIAAVTGADMGAMLNSSPAPLWQSFFCAPGDVLSFSYCRSGCRGYLAISGGIEVPRVLGSRSTLLAANFGGYCGRALREGDTIKTGDDRTGMFFIMEMPGPKRPVYQHEIKVRVVRGLNADMFCGKDYDALFAAPYIVSIRSDRMGCFLEGGRSVGTKTAAEKESFPVVPGSIQVIPTGNPVVLLNDAQSTGGYSQIAGVASAELWKIAQAKAGDMVFFEEIDLRTAGQLLQEKERELDYIQQVSPARLYNKTERNVYEITVQ